MQRCNSIIRLLMLLGRYTGHSIVYAMLQLARAVNAELSEVNMAAIKHYLGYLKGLLDLVFTNKTRQFQLESHRHMS